VGWEDLYLEDENPAEGWRIEAGRLRYVDETVDEDAAWIVKGPALASWLAVVNARLEGDGLEKDGWYGFGLDPGPRIRLKRRVKDWILGTGEHILPLPDTFDPSIDQQFRLWKVGSRLEIAWEGLDLGGLEVPPGPARLTIGAAGRGASFETTRLTAI
jgi:hypothetical protein